MSDQMPGPRRDLGAYTTSELARYRKDLEQARQGLAESAPFQKRLAELLDLVSAEEESRAAISQTGRTGYPGL